jgi:hypothetical protein
MTRRTCISTLALQVAPLGRRPLVEVNGHKESSVLQFTDPTRCQAG